MLLRKGGEGGGSVRQMFAFESDQASRISTAHLELLTIDRHFLLNICSENGVQFNARRECAV